MRILVMSLMLILTSAIPLRSEDKVVLPSKFGIGYVSSIGAIGGRYWYSNKKALDLGFGYHASTNSSIYSVTAGWVWMLQNTKQLLLEVRWGTSYRTQLNNLAFGAILMVEYFPVDSNRFSLSSGIGPHLIIHNLGRSNQFTDSDSVASTLIELGFHYYFSPLGGSDSNAGVR